MRNFWSIIFAMVLSGVTAIAPCNGIIPDGEIDGKTIAGYISDGDTILVIELAPVDVLAPRQFDSRREARRYGRMVRNVKAAYPYASLAGNMFREYSEILLEIDNERDRRRFTEAVEKQIRAQFEEDLKRLTFSQGLILIKLIDRETQRTSYDILKDFRGAFSAVFWQSLGRLFGLNLKTEYDPEGDDKLIEEIVQLIEAGLI
jgi:hypothetical protein